MREISFGPVANPDGTPSDVTIAMLAGTGRDPVEFAQAINDADAIEWARITRWYDGDMHSTARNGANIMRRNAYDRIVDGAYDYMTRREVMDFCEAMQTFAPLR